MPPNAGPRIGAMIVKYVTIINIATRNLVTLDTMNGITPGVKNAMANSNNVK